MASRFVILVVVVGTACHSLCADEIQRGTLKSLNVEKRQVVVTIEGRDREFALTDDTQVLGETGKDLAEKLKGFAAGAEVFVKPTQRDGRDVLVGIKLASPRKSDKTEKSPSARGDGETARRVSPEHATLKPLTELGRDEYHGFGGGLYPRGENARPKEHDAAGLKLAAQVRPRDASGQPDPDGKIVLLSIGMSNTSQASQAFAEALNHETSKHP
ncbi:MAG TPA: hypothetical protein VK137_01480, partial [Planctomycetaceae bacterium]|nr:hypothetical protein [Planctomycetaceae bacterium]